MNAEPASSAPGIRLEDVVVEGRHRKSLGDLASLMASISSIGLLHPIIVDRNKRLVAGQRRLEACRRLGWEAIPYRVVDGLEDATRALVAERDENTCRLDMSVSEMVALGRALEELERPKAQERIAQGQALGRAVIAGQDVSPPGRLDQLTREKTSDVVGQALGVSGATYERMAYVHQVAEDETLPPTVRAVAQQAVEALDEGAPVRPTYNQVRQLVRDENPKVLNVPRNLRMQKARSLALTMPNVVASLRGFTAAFDKTTASDLSDVTPADAAAWAQDISTAIGALRRVRNLLAERASS